MSFNGRLLGFLWQFDDAKILNEVAWNLVWSQSVLHKDLGLLVL